MYAVNRTFQDNEQLLTQVAEYCDDLSVGYDERVKRWKTYGCYIAEVGSAHKDQQKLDAIAVRYQGFLIEVATWIGRKVIEAQYG